MICKSCFASGYLELVVYNNSQKGIKHIQHLTASPQLFPSDIHAYLANFTSSTGSWHI